jgi:hypothetical protein
MTTLAPPTKVELALATRAAVQTDLRQHHMRRPEHNARPVVPMAVPTTSPHAKRILGRIAGFHFRKLGHCDVEATGDRVAGLAGTVRPTSLYLT